ncbi:OmpA family protein [uncultured Bacteroides sp.]|uniref:OmpA family protein n=1 Tax=uncultured Bacteroides sp. TaxID=162156 RepID=UPI002608EFD5|nr:OmpA family protein [uncultured Bacteroides sp.]
MKKIILLILAVILAFPTFASDSEKRPKSKYLSADSVTTYRHYKWSDNWFMGFFGGVNHSLSENNRFGKFKKSMGPEIGFGIGKYFSPSFGFRMRTSWAQQKSRANAEAIAAYPDVYAGKHDFYRFNMGTIFFDALFNFTQMCHPMRQSRFNIIGIAGIGGNSTWGFSDYVKDWPQSGYVVDTSSGIYFAMHAGLLASYKLSERWDIAAEITANATDDAYNGVKDDRRYDCYVYGVIGFIHHFKDQYGDRRFKTVTVTNQAEIQHLNEQINELRKQPAPVVQKDTIRENEVLDMTVNFYIDKWYISDLQRPNIQKVVDFLNEHPDVNLIITGYADVQTAYPAYNWRLSIRRAEAVYKVLVNDYNVNPDRIRVDYKGDTIQPYQIKNEWNRVVVFITEKPKAEKTEN